MWCVQGVNDDEWAAFFPFWYNYTLTMYTVYTYTQQKRILSVVNFLYKYKFLWDEE